MPATSVQPETGLIWIDNADPNVGTGVAAPEWAMLLQTVASELWYKSATNNTAWAKVGGGGGGGGITNAIQSISAGTTNVTGPGVSFANGGGVSFGANGSTITASVASQTPETPFAIAAGTQSVSTGTVTFANAGNVTFGMAGSNQITATATVAAIKSISGGTTNATGQGVSFADGNGVSFGVNGNTITASITAGIANAVRTISGGTTNMTGPGVSFSNGSGVTFGVNGNTITASVAAEASFSQYAPWIGNSLSFSLIGQSSLHIQPRTVPNVVFSQFNQLISWANNAASIGTCSFTVGVGVYTKNVSSLSLLMSTTFSASIGFSGITNDSLNNGIRLVTAPWTSTISRGDYYFGHLVMSTTSSANGTLRPALQHALQGAAFSGLLGVTQASSVQEQLGLGVLSVQTAALPNSIAFSDLVGTVINPPAIAFGSTV